MSATDRAERGSPSLEGTMRSAEREPAFGSMKYLRTLKQARAAGALRDVDYHLARHLLAIAAKPSNELALAIAALSRAQGSGDICLDLAACAGTKLFGDGDELIGVGADGEMPQEESTRIEAPPLAEWRAALLESGIVGDSAAAGLPLVLDAANRLYFAKYRAFEKGIAQGLLARAVTNPLASDADIERMLDVHFGRDEAHVVDRRGGIGSHSNGDSGERVAPGHADPHQRAAARIALTRQLAVITGGPGTGKTTTVAKILAAMIGLALEAGSPLPRIRLAAPTGKAAARLGESIRAAKARMSDAPLAAHIPENASTLHRLIGTRPDTRRPRHDPSNTLALDVLVIDEASMIDVPLMARVIAALPGHARLVLLGDADQLASVEAGAVLGDICRGVADTTPISASIATLVTSHRFAANRGIGELAQAINAGDAARALAACRGDPVTVGGGDHIVTLHSGNDAATLERVIEASIVAFRACIATDDVVEATRRFGEFRVLCALREGPSGVVRINAAIERSLALAGLADSSKRHWRGRPLLITANDYGVELFNGDIGLVWPDDDGTLRACFVGPDGRVKRLPLNRLPEHETAFAMTVHKSQGSEFDRIALVLPERDAPVLTRELVYTAVTRARTAVDIYGSETLLADAIRRRVSRSSGLRDALWGAGGRMR